MAKTKDTKHTELERFNPWNVFNGSFVPEVVSRLHVKHLSQGAKLAYGRLLRYAGRNGVAYPKVELLAAEIGVNKRMAIRHTKELLNFGLLEKERRGMGRSNCYHFLWHPIFDRTYMSLHDRTDMSPPSIEESHLKEKDFDKSKSSLQKGITTNKKKRMDEDIVPVGEDGEEVTTGRWGRPLKKVPKKTRTPQNVVALRIIKKFNELCKRNIGVEPMEHIKNYMIVLNAMNKGQLSEDNIYDLFEEWFGFGKADDETIQITRALSANQVNGYKARNLK